MSGICYHKITQKETDVECFCSLVNCKVGFEFRIGEMVVLQGGNLFHLKCWRHLEPDMKVTVDRR